MKKKPVFILIACLVLFNLNVVNGTSKKLSRKERKRIFESLEDKYKLWLNQINYISFKEERETFLSLKNNRDRDMFINFFWQQRDPTPGTTENEYKKEIEERFRYVNQNFKWGASKPGWMTDMGRFYMILGKSTSIDRFDNRAGLVPAQVWYYHGDRTLGLPTYFNITFFKPNNTTEWKLYNPLIDGPQALLIQTENYSSGSYEALYRKIYELAPTLAMPAVTMIPNQVEPNFRPSPRIEIILSKIEQAPIKKINVTYARDFLTYKGYVDVETSINYIASTNLVSVTKYERFGFHFVNISFKPKEISLLYSEEKNQYYFNFELNISLKKDNKFIYEYKKNFDLYFDPDKINTLKANGIVIHDSFPVIPGKYKLTVLAMNSARREFSYFDKNIVVPPTDQNPTLAAPIMGYKAEVQHDSFFFTYRFNKKKLFIDTNKNFRFGERPLVLIGIYNLNKKLWKNGKIIFDLIGLNEKNNFKKKYEFLLSGYSYKKDLNILYSIVKNGENLESDYYELSIRLVDETRNIIDTKMIEFSISPLRSFAHSIETFKKIRVDNPYYFYYILGVQYEKTGDNINAKKYYEKCIQNNPGFFEGHILYLNILNKQKKYEKVLKEVENLKGNDNYALDYYLIKATALYGKKDFNGALKELLKANKIYDSDIRVLNLIGFTFLNLNNYDEALRALNTSLSLNKNQKFVSRAIEEIKKRMRLKK